MHHRRWKLGALALALTATLAACGGGGGGSSGTTTPASTTTTVTVTPTLGRFSAGTVTAYGLDGSTLGSGTIDATSGSAQLQIPGSYTGPYVIAVTGGSYFDEATGTTQSQPAQSSLVAVIASSAPAVVGVNAITNAAAALLGVQPAHPATTVTSNGAQQANLAAATLLGLPGVDPTLIIPTPITSSSSQISGLTPADQLATKLASLAEMSSNASYGSIDAVDSALASQLAAAQGNVANASLGSTFVNDFDTAQASAVASYAAPAVQSALPSPAETTLSTTQVSAISSGSMPPSNLAAAESFIGTVSKGLAPYISSSGTAFLNQQVDGIKADFLGYQDPAMGGLDEALRIAGFVQRWLAGTPSGSCVSMLDGSLTCQADVGNAWSPYGSSVNLVKVPGSGGAVSAVNWTVHNLSNGNVNTGVVTVNDNGVGDDLTLNGYLDGMTRNSVNARVGAATKTCNGITQTLGKPFHVVITPGATTTSVAITGGLIDLVPDAYFGVTSCFGTTPDLSLNLGQTSAQGTLTPATMVISNSGDKSQNSGDLFGTLTTPHYSFQGELKVPSITTYQPAGSSYSWITGGTLNFSGQVYGSGETYLTTAAVLQPVYTPVAAFTLLKGTIDSSIVPSSGYNPSQPDSASNSRNYTLTLDGTVHDSSTDPGLRTTLTLSRNWPSGSTGYQDTVALQYYDNNQNLTVSGSMSALEPSPLDTLTLSGGNGVTLNWSRLTQTGSVLSSGQLVGNISGLRLTFTDGSFASLF